MTLLFTPSEVQLANPSYTGELVILPQVPQGDVVGEPGGTYPRSWKELKLPEVIELVACHSKVNNWDVAVMTVEAEHGFNRVEFRLSHDSDLDSSNDTFRAAMTLARKADDTRILVHPVAERQT